MLTERQCLSFLEVDIAHLAVADVVAGISGGVESADDGFTAGLVIQVGKVDVVRVLS